MLEDILKTGFAELGVTPDGAGAAAIPDIL